MRSLFMQIITELIFDFEEYYNKIDDDIAFNTYTYILNKDKNYRPFYAELVTGDSFINFIKEYILNPDKEFYFKKRLLSFKDIKKEKKHFKDYIKILSHGLKMDYLSFLQIKKNTK